MSTLFEPARLDDIAELLALYRRVYGSSYALPLGTDPATMAAEISAERTCWLVAKANGRIVASIVATVESRDRLGKLQGLVVDPDHRGSGLAHLAVGTVSEQLLASGEVDSVYGTARTTATAPQRTCLRNGFQALGIFPNLRKAAQHETMVLLGKHRDTVLRQRAPVHKVPRSLGGLIDAAQGAVGMPVMPELVPESDHTPASKPVVLELVDAPQFVQRRFEEAVRDPARRFYPFHQPNVLLTEATGEFEVYAHLSRTDGYCTLIGASPDASTVFAHLDGLIERLNSFGAYYIETLVPLDSFEQLCALLAHGFLPAALYPAMRRNGENFGDYVVMARTMQPLNFRGLAIDKAFRPYAEQFINLWTRRHLDTNGVFR